MSTLWVIVGIFVVALMPLKWLAHLMVIVFIVGVGLWLIAACAIAGFVLYHIFKVAHYFFGPAPQRKPL